jgi:beta-phosphoglucomutase family hydrolase
MPATDVPDLFDGTVECVLFDLDGVITDTASVHEDAWKFMFDGFLQAEADRDGTEFSEFTQADYHAYVDGKPRYDGVRSFLAARGITLPDGDPEDPPAMRTVSGLGNRKNDAFLAVLRDHGAVVYEGTVALIDRLREAGIPVGCVSSSRNCRLVLESVGLLERFDAILDGTDAAARCIPGKPAPDTYVTCAQDLKAEPGRSVMVEDAISGVQSGAAGGFAHVVGVDRGVGRDALTDHGATVVVDDLAELLPG